MKGYIKLRKKALDDLNTKLSSKLSYHSVDHTLGALETCELYLKHMNIDARQAKLLRIGILFHDIGFTETIIAGTYRGLSAERYALCTACDTAKGPFDHTAEPWRRRSGR